MHPPSQPPVHRQGAARLGGGQPLLTVGADRQRRRRGRRRSAPDAGGWPWPGPHSPPGAWWILAGVGGRGGDIPASRRRMAPGFMGGMAMGIGRGGGRGPGREPLGDGEGGGGERERLPGQPLAHHNVPGTGAPNTDTPSTGDRSLAWITPPRGSPSPETPLSKTYIREILHFSGDPGDSGMRLGRTWSVFFFGLPSTFNTMVLGNPITIKMLRGSAGRPDWYALSTTCGSWAGAQSSRARLRHVMHIESGLFDGEFWRETLLFGAPKKGLVRPPPSPPKKK